MYYGRSEKRAARLHFSVGIKSKEKVRTAFLAEKRKGARIKK